MTTIQQSSPARRGGRRGLTLIELMVVILIIGIIAGVLTVAVTGAFGKGRDAEAQSTIRLLTAAIDSFEAQMRIYPPSSLDSLSQAIGQPATDPNTTNKGIEALVLALRGRALPSGALLQDDDFNRLRVNTDNADGGEIMTSDPTGAGGNMLAWELRDPWGNPFVYVNFQDEFNSLIDPIIEVIDGTGTQHDIDLQTLKDALIDPATGVSVAPIYALWSFGPDGINDYGKGDDVVSWTKLP